MLKKIKNIFQAGPFNILSFIAMFLVLLVFLSWFVDGTTVPQVLSHSDFLKELEKGTVKKIRVEENRVFGKFNDGKSFEASVHMTESIWNTLNSKGIDVSIVSENQGFDGWYIVGLLGIVILGIIIWMIVRRSKGGGGGGPSIFMFGKSRFKKVSPGEVVVKFKDVAGAKSAKEALQDIIDFLKDPERFKKVGAHIPKGVLLAGEPGTGKTLLARAVAGEANCTFLSISGSDFIEVFVGVGAARIRDLFGQARKNVPCILFIDEIDAIGRSRGSGMGGGHDEREQTLNQLLTEMDGFDQFTEPLVVIAATNMPEVLDKALLRPGRFDRVVYVPYPDLNARLELLKIYCLKIKTAEDLKLEEIAEITHGLSGADLENLVNIAALRASREAREVITNEDFKKSHKDVLDSKRDIQRSGTDQVKEFLPQQVKTRFKDVAGLDDAKDDFEEIVDFLKNPKKYEEMGARIPRGVLLSGDPGNGKTLLARAVAGEAGVPFFYASGSQFIQKYVGVGAERIRELFNQARKHAPSIIFIDELDSIGKRDSENESKEHNQTINQLLTEMDGFIQDEVPVVVIAATNLIDSIDKALKRAGRFDRQINVPYPNLKTRLKILRVHAVGKKFSEDIKLEEIARGTPGFSGASLEGLLNEAAIMAVSSKKQFIDKYDIEEARDRILMGKKNFGLMRKNEELKKTAYHECGHVLTKIFQKDYPFSFYKVTILSRGGTLGVSQGLPKDDMTGFTKEELFAKIVVSMGGRAAEEIVFGDIGTGASADFSNATDIAKKMVMVYGMSEKIGPVSFVDYRSASQETLREVDLEIKRILNEAYKKAIDLLTEKRETLDRLSAFLIEKETLDANEVYSFVGIEKPKDKIFFEEE